MVQPKIELGLGLTMDLGFPGGGGGMSNVLLVESLSLGTGILCFARKRRIFSEFFNSVDI